ncbi:RuvC family protein [Arenibaculum pallidiluteum]|uniref:hypothetical protein n=1 Tax=Arenibaculum pallidiluteum TaxID=2812559 RepID=UPI001A959A9E|nr:hypothetical protein [Arenibaculum pallidiluteum]
MIAIGIDPGLSGAVAFFLPTDELRVFDLPLVAMSGGKKGRNEVDPVALRRLIAEHVTGPAEAFLEQVGAMPNQGAVSMFRFGMTYGQIRGLLAGLLVPVTRPTPAEWKRALRVPADKKQAIGRATELLPAHADQWAIRRGHCNLEQAAGRAEAALLALWGRRQRGPRVEDLLS